MDIELSVAPISFAKDGISETETIARDLPYLVWKNVTVAIPSIQRRPARMLLNDLNGYAEPGRIMAIMGPSGSGKSTLLDALSGRLAGNVMMSGDVLLNGKKRKLNYGGVAYVTQEDTLLGTLTVRETIAFSARLRLPGTLEEDKVQEIIERTILEMGLQECADTLIGNWHLRGISGGEKKRLSIALDILVKPKILFLDEPTTGLDSAASFFVVHTLRNIAQDGRIVICSIHQPSSEVFALFDDLFLLSSGEPAYFGKASVAVQFFAEVGFPCPSKRNPADHFLRCINSDFDLVSGALTKSKGNSAVNLTSDIRAMLLKKYKNSTYADKTRTRMRQIMSAKENEIEEKKKGKQVSSWKQLRVLTKRSFTNMWRDLGYYWVRIGIYTALSICVGTVFFDVGRSYSAIIARGSCVAFISGFMTFMSIGGFPSFIEEIKVFQKERLKGYYGVGVYCLSNMLSSLPYLVTLSLVTSSITYYMVKFRSEVSHFVYIFLDLLACIAAVESCMMTIAAMVPNFLMGVIVGAGYIAILLMTSGFFRMITDLPKFFWRYPMSYVNYGTWGLQGAYKNDMLGIEFEPLVPGDPKIKGEYILQTILGVDLSFSKWWDLFLVVVMLLVFRILFFLVLKFKEKVLPILNVLYAKRIMRTLQERPSFRINSPYPSRRHQNLHPLSLQEGMSSPIA